MYDAALAHMFVRWNVLFMIRLLHNSLKRQM